jgi:hypothetical protein
VSEPASHAQIFDVAGAVEQAARRVAQLTDLPYPGTSVAHAAADEAVSRLELAAGWLRFWAVPPEERDSTDGNH